MLDKKPGDIILWFFLTLFLLSCIMLGWLLLPFLSVIILGAVVTGVFNPVYRFFLEKRQVRPHYASLITCALIFLFLFVPTLFFVGILSKEAYELYLMGKGAVISDQIKTLLDNSWFLEKANSIFSNIGV
ncbi:MAG: AI-2E family transporter, partial [Deltaproteobacteria bacterium]|nr:AI-2E family transporter [Deltaproteobacteria bacterium]